MTIKKGIIAAGHSLTAEIASEALQQGGNAFDAVVSAMAAACVAEPVLASPGGGGFLMALQAGSPPIVYDFFAQTPLTKSPPEALDFYPIVADFGTASQTFHIGMGAMATPGFVRGLCLIHRECCRMPLSDILQPAIELARKGVVINPFQALISRIVSPILQATPAALAAHASPADAKRLIQASETHYQPGLADLFDLLIHEGDSIFYAGEIGRQLAEDSLAMGGHLTREDLINYQAVKRAPLQHTYRNAQLITNPLPSLGGTLIAFALGLLQTQPLGELMPGSEAHLRHLSRVMRLTQEGREGDHTQLGRLLSAEIQLEYQRVLQNHAQAKRGTTQISIADADGNLASMTLSNGEGCGYMIPGTGVMMNNMLGEEDLNPRGFHGWLENRRLASMMSPSLLLTPSGDAIVTGSGGSNRIRSAVLQVISNMLDFSMSPAAAVSHPRIHFENELLSLEPGIDARVADALADEFPKQQRWQEKNLFFGGAHTILRDSKGGFAGVGDERRGGVCIQV